MGPGHVTFGVTGSSFFGNVSNCFSLSTKNLRGGKSPPPPPARGLTAGCSLKIQDAMSFFCQDFELKRPNSPGRGNPALGQYGDKQEATPSFFGWNSVPIVTSRPVLL